MIERVSLFNNKRDFFIFLSICSFILFYSLLIHYQNYKELTRFDTQLLNVRVVKQYTKSKNNQTFQILKIKSDNGLVFYTAAKKSQENILYKNIKLKVWAGKVTFYEYMTSFYTYSQIKQVYEIKTKKQELNDKLDAIHVDNASASIYKALYTATPLHVELQQTFSTLGVSHLLAISGFHLGVLSALLFFLLKPIYSFFQDKYFPYRNSRFDLFVIVISILLAYLLFLDSPPSLLRAFGMFLVGFVLYDRGIKIISMQTLVLTVLLLLSFFPKLFFALGFWLSVIGVFYIFLFLIHFKTLNKIWQFVLIPFWVYILMLPFSLSIFGNFSLYHPLSIIWTTLFTLFYPLSLVLHILGFGSILDDILHEFTLLGQENALHVVISLEVLALHVGLSLLSVFYKRVVWILLVFSIFIFIYAIYQVT